MVLGYQVMYDYSINWMGPINMDWIKEHGEGWSAGRIDIYGDGLDYPDEIALPPMKSDDWQSFGDWLETVETDTKWTLEQLVTEYEKTDKEIVWLRTPEWKK